MASAAPLPQPTPQPERTPRRVRELVTLLERFAAAPTLRARLDAAQRAVRFIVARDKGIPLPAGETLSPPPEWRRLVVAIALLEGTPALRERVVAALGAIFAETQALPLLARAGLPSDRGLAQETADRFFRRVLPVPRDEQDLATSVLRLFPTARELEWLQALPADVFLRLSEVLSAGEPASPFGPALEAAADALVLLGARVQALGLSDDIRSRSRPSPLRASPFHQLARGADLFVALLDDAGRRIQAEREWRAAVVGCREELAVVLAQLESTGISLDVVYELEVIEQSLARMEALASVLTAPPGLERAAAAHRLLAVLIEARRADRSLRALARSNLHLLARKIIERAGRTGEHYITYGRRDYFGMMLSAAGGGALTAGTAALKVLIALQRYPLFVEGFLSGINYSLSFLLIQICGFTLATKQPSMTAATLAGTLRDSGPGRLDELVTQVARICRSQLAAAIGNVAMVSVAAVAFDRFWRWRTGGSFLGAETVGYVLGSLHPFQSGTVFFAALTGVILWTSSLAAGWIENFFVYRRLPQAIADHRLGRIVGQRTMERLSRLFARNISGFGGSIALGFMLGMTPVLGKFVGLQIDVRHVTLSTGTLAFAATSRGANIFHDPAFWWAVSGIAVIFVLNLGVSFSLALAVALRAREVPARDRVALVRALAGRFLRSPGQFLFPPRGDARPADH